MPKLHKSAPPPVILQMVYDNRTADVIPHQGSTISYSVPSAASSSYHLTINVNNMAAVAGQVLLRCAVLGNKTAPQSQHVSVEARAVASAIFVVDLSASVRASQRGCDETGQGGGNQCSASLWGLATVDVTATAVSGFELGGADHLVSRQENIWEERLSLNFAVT